MANDARITLSAEDRFSATFAAFKRQLQQGDQAVAGFGTRIAGLGLSLGALGAGFSVAGVLASVKSIADGLDALNDASDATGETVENLSALEDVARRNGGSLDTVTGALVKMNQALVAAKEDSPASRALKAIGLSAKELRQQSPSDALQAIARSLAGFADDGNKARIVQELFGKSLREIAPLLKDIVEKGELNATVTRKQAEEAERFNKALGEISTNAGNAARSIGGPLITALNEGFQRFKDMREIFGSFSSGALSMGSVFTIGKADIENQRAAREEVQRLEASVANLVRTRDRQGGMLGLFDSSALKRFEADLVEARKKLDFFNRAQLRDALSGSSGVLDDPRFRRGAAAPSLPDLTDAGKPKKDQVSEAQRYLETLQKQGEQVEKLTDFEKALNDISNNRIDGITPKLRQEILARARLNEIAEEALKLKEKEAGFQKLLGDLRQKEVNSALDSLANTPTGQSEAIEQRADRLVEFMREPSNQTPENMKKFNEAMEQLKTQLKDIGKTADELHDPFASLADSIEKSMDRATGAVLDFVVEGKGGVGDLGKAFSRDILRALIEEPIRDTMKAASKTILEAFKNGGSSSGGGFLDLIGGLFGGIFGGGAARANGGRVRAGQPVWVGENGREPFIPDSDGTILSNSAGRRMGGANAPVINQTWNITGPLPAEQLAMVRAVVDQNNAKLLRSMRTGGAFSGA